MTKLEEKLAEVTGLAMEAMNESAGNDQVRELFTWTLPIQERHFQDVLQSSRKLAGEENPNETA